jgi:hypothetical protein
MIEPHSHTPPEAITAGLIDKLLDHLRTGYFLDFLEPNVKWLTKAGLLGLYVAALLGLASSVVLPLRYDLHFGISLAAGVLWFLLCIVIHYTAWKFLPVLAHIIRSTPTQFSSRAFLDSFALVAGLAGAAALLVGLFFWIKTSSFEAFMIGLFVFIFCEYVMCLCLHPQALNIEISEQTSAGDEFIGLVSFFMKGFLKLIPIAFGSGIILGILSILTLLFSKLEYMGQILEAIYGAGTFMYAALLPVTGYIFFLAYYFVIDLARALLAIPAKLDSLNSDKVS